MGSDEQALPVGGFAAVGLAAFLAGCAPMQRLHAGGGTAGPAMPVGSSSPGP